MRGLPCAIRGPTKCHRGLATDIIPLPGCVDVQGSMEAIRLLKTLCAPLVIFKGALPDWYTDRKTDSDRSAFR